MNNPPIIPRPLKYRAWTGSELVVVQTLCFNEGGIIWYGHNPHMGFSYVWDSPMWTEDNPKPSKGDLKPVMEWMGMHDKDGREIYEGDIVEISPPFAVPVNSREVKSALYVVGRSGTGLSFRLIYDVLMPEGCSWGSHVVYKYRIVGNVYETPELLKP